MQTLRTLNVLKTDIRGFTVRSSEISSTDLDELLTEHRLLTERVVERHGGTIFKEMGDSFLVVFESATAAVQAGVDLQRELSVTQAGLGDDHRVEVRATVTTGDLFEQDGDYFGMGVNLAARMEAITPAGEVYVAHGTMTAAHDPSFEFELVGDYGFKGVPGAVPVYRAVFKHATRTIRSVAIMFTDIMRFSSYANTHECEEVEQLLDTWESAHRRVLNKHSGQLRLVSGDQFLTTFPDANTALAAALDLTKYVQEWNAEHPDGAIQFGVGIEVGDIHIYRTAIFGPAANRADFCREAAMHVRDYVGYARVAQVVLTGVAKDSLGSAASAGLKRMDEDADNLARRMKNRQIEALWLLIDEDA
jgi:class 3 adenylate cyclase